MSEKYSISLGKLDMVGGAWLLGAWKCEFTLKNLTDNTISFGPRRMWLGIQLAGREKKTYRNVIHGRIVSFGRVGPHSKKSKTTIFPVAGLMELYMVEYVGGGSRVHYRIQFGGPLKGKKSFKGKKKFYS